MDRIFSYIDTESRHHREACKLALASELVSRHGMPLSVELSHNTTADVTRAIYERARLPVPESSSHQSINVAQLKGYKTWRSLFTQMDRMNLACVAYQEEFRRMIINSILPHIYNEDGEWDLHQTAIREYHGVKRMRPILAMSCARQMGKTTIVASLLAAIATVCRGINVLVVSIGQRASNMLKGVWKDKLRLVDDNRRVGQGYIRSDSALNGTITSRSLGKVQGDSCVFRFVPSTANSSRGQQVDLAIVDEAAFVREDIFKALLLPILAVTKAVCVCISTPPTVDNFFTQLLVKCDPTTGELLADVVRNQSVCAACSEKRLTTCPHVDTILPPWQQDHGRRRYVAMLYGDDDNNRARETSGIVVMDARPAFEPMWIDALSLDSARYTFDGTRPDAIMVAIDPTGGGASHVGISVLAVHRSSANPTIVVLGGASIDASAADGSVQVAAVRSIILQLRRDHRFSRSTIVACIEGNLNQLDACTLGNAIIQSTDNVIVMSETRACSSAKRMVNGPYVLLNPHCGKQRYVQMASFFFRSFRIGMLDKMITSDVGGSARFRETLITQLKRFMVEEGGTGANGPNAKVYKTYHGKGPNGRVPDDACMAFLMGVYHFTIFYASKTYSRARQCPPLYLVTPTADNNSDSTQQLIQLVEAETNDAALAQQRIARLPYNPNSPDARAPINFGV